jgi:hypothetical protein
MRVRFPRVAAAIGSLIIAAACGRSSPSSPTPAIRLVTPAAPAPAYVEVIGLPGPALAALRRTEWQPDQWSALLRVGVDDQSLAMLGAYTVADDALRFTPSFPFDPGRTYHVRFDPARLPGDAGSASLPPIVTTVARAAEHTTPTTVVARVYPTGDVVPENLLRMYVEFSAPMSRPSGIPFMKLLDEHNEEIRGAFLPLDYEFWSPDHTRFTAFFDPGRVKDGILPNQQMGRPLHAGQHVTLVINREWRDANGLPLKDDYRRVFTVGPMDREPLDTATWKLGPPAAPRTRDPLVVEFPEPLDHGLLMRAMGVTRDGATLDGEIVVGAGETRWTFTPREPWRAGTYQLLALDILEDVAGNQIGRAFEVDNFDTVDNSPNPKTITIPFHVTP